jgi:hypothetical protein
MDLPQQHITNISNPCNLAMKYRLWYSFDIHPVKISNKENLKPHEYKSEPEYKHCWIGGYSFKHFWSNCHFLLGEIAHLDGIQQLCHQYYLQNGSLGAISTVARIKKFLGLTMTLLSLND